MSRSPHVHAFKLTKTSLGIKRVCACGETVTEVKSAYTPTSPLDEPLLAGKRKRLERVKSPWKRNGMHLSKPSLNQ